ncbi:DUF4238 domain-containing protein [candidate division WOR-3 bacterium]|nr:DUF4238 domain-containing protein [candidate division WOR-3 bacterium]
MNKKRSKKHHYLPRYYLRGFANSEGGFFVYDKHTGKIFATSPDAAFFENNLNTTESPDGNQSDFLEDFYTEIENQSWNSLDSIRDSDFNTPIKHLDKMHLFCFLLFLHWRLPCNIELIDKLSDEFFRGDNDIDYLKLLSKTDNAVPKETIERIRRSPVFKKSAKQIVPLAPFFKDENWCRNLEDWRFIYSGDGNSWYIVGDNPIITHGDSDHDPVNCLKKFIFPVSGKILLVSGYGHTSQVLPPEFGIQYGAGIIERAQRFVACQNQGFLEALIKHHQLHVQFGKTDIIITELFGMLDKKDGKGKST